MWQRMFGRTGRSVGELGLGMWGMGGGIGGWTGADDRRWLDVLQAAVDVGVTFLDSAQVYGYGATDRLLGAIGRSNPDRGLFLASKVPPKKLEWPARPGTRACDSFPLEHVRASVEGILQQAGLDVLDLVQFHVWQDDWGDDPGWRRAVEALRRDGLVRRLGIY